MRRRHQAEGLSRRGHFPGESDLCYGVQGKLGGEGCEMLSEFSRRKDKINEQNSRHMHREELVLT